MDGINLSGPTARLAELMLDADFRRDEVDQESIESARREQHDALGEQIHALHEAAHHTRIGAWVEGALGVGGAGLSVTATVGKPCNKTGANELKLLGRLGAAMDGVAKPMGKLTGDAPAAESTADAKRAEQKRTDAGARADQAQRHRDRVQSNEDFVLDELKSIQETESQGHFAIIAKV